MPRVLFIGLVWPEPTSSAAGWRILQLVDFFRKKKYEVHFASSAQWSEFSHPLQELGVKTHVITLNHSGFDPWIRDIHPGVVVFDRFVTEEQFGWRVRENVPGALTVLDTEDLHFVRKARETAYKKNKVVDYYTEEAKRELASILRCDLSLIISEWEMNLLTTTFAIPSSLLHYLPFLQEKLSEATIAGLPGFSERRHFMFIGNFIHEPNYQAVLRLKKMIWPVLKEKLPDAELHVYGAYPTQKIWQLHQPHQRFLIKGRAADVHQIMADYKILLAPIPFGAGIKGKFVDAMQNGLPAVTHIRGSESMGNEENWPGFIADDVDDFTAKAAELYTDALLWKQKQEKGIQLYNEKYDKIYHEEQLKIVLATIKAHLNSHRNAHFIGQILQSNQLNTLKYLSKWIEEKQTK